MSRLPLIEFSILHNWKWLGRHVPTIRPLGTCTHINPGTVTYPLSNEESKRRPTCGVIEGDDVYLLDLGTGERLSV